MPFNESASAEPAASSPADACRNTHVTFTNSAGDDVIGVIKSFEVGLPGTSVRTSKGAESQTGQDGTYHIQVRSELGSDETLEVAEHKVRELKVTDPAPCPVAGSQKSYVH